MWSGESLIQFAFARIIRPFAFPLLDITISVPFTWAHSTEVVGFLKSSGRWEGMVDTKSN